MSTPFSIGMFHAGDAADAFVGAVVSGHDDTVLDLDTAAVALDLRTELPATVEGIVSDWAACFPELCRIVDASAQRGMGELGEAVHTMSSLQVRPPLRPAQVLQAGANYRQHVIEMSILGRDVSEEEKAELMAKAAVVVAERARTGTPYVFLGSPAAICGPFDDVVLPVRGNQHDWEIELAVVIGAEASHVDVADAYDYVAGYTIANDLTTRDEIFRSDVPAIGTDWLRCKNWPTALPLGPVMLPAAFVADPMELVLELRLNGEIQQHSAASDMVHGIDQLIAYTSTLTRLSPGDILLTGSPAGNGSFTGRFLAPGDVMEGSITGMGVQRNRCVAAPARPTPVAAAPGSISGGD